MACSFPKGKAYKKNRPEILNMKKDKNEENAVLSSKDVVGT